MYNNLKERINYAYIDANRVYYNPCCIQYGL